MQQASLRYFNPNSLQHIFSQLTDWNHVTKEAGLQRKNKKATVHSQWPFNNNGLV